MTIIESPHNATFKKLLSLTTAKGLKKEGLFLLSGTKLIREFLAAPSLDIFYEVHEDGQKPLEVDAPSLQLTPPLFAHVDVLGTHAPLLVVKQPSLPRLDSFEGYIPHGIEVVVPVGDPANLGAVIRSAEAFGVPRIILTREAAHPFLPKAVKASAGSVLRVRMIQGPALDAVPESCMALDMEGEDINSFDWPSDGLLLLGEEGSGLDARRFKTRVRIPIQGVESLNVAVAAGIALSRVPRRPTVPQSPLR
ncbi:MAG: RNA methyltransferase [Alphaproteobacteria bacterium]|nr:RNA methyltransferase [Alphaproteobacteria bacterium]